MRNDETRITDLTLLEEREKAIYVRDKNGVEAWLPRSVITVSKAPIVSGAEHRTISVTMPDWLAYEKRL